MSEGRVDVRDAVTGTVLGRDGEPLEAATVTLVDGTPSRLIRSPARTEVPPKVVRCGNRPAKVSSAATEATKCSPPPPRAR